MNATPKCVPKDLIITTTAMNVRWLFRNIIYCVFLVFIIVNLISDVNAAVKKPAAAAASSTSGGAHKEAVIEEVTAKQLERILNEKDFVAVYWCKC